MPVISYRETEEIEKEQFIKSGGSDREHSVWNPGLEDHWGWGLEEGE